MITSLLIMVFGLVTGSLTAKLLGVVGRGELASIQLYGSLFASICASGLPAAVTYFTGSDPEKAGEYYLTGIGVALLLAVPCAIGGFFAIPHLLTNQRYEVVSAAQLYLLFIPLGIVTSFSLASLQGQMKMLLWNLLRIIAGVFWLIPLVGLFFYRDVDAVTVSRVYLLFLFLYGCVFVAILLRALPGRIRILRELFRPLWRYALPTSVATFSQQSNLKLDQIFIAALLPPQLLGIYVVSIAWSAAHSPLIGAVSYAIVPHMLRINSAEDRRTAICRITRTSMILNVVLATAMLAVTPAAIRILFGNQFLGAVTVSFILIIGSVFSNMKGVIAEGLRGMCKPEIVMKGELLGLSVSLFLFPLLLSIGQLLGVAVASVAGYVATVGFLLLQLGKISGATVREVLVPCRADLSYLLNQAEIVIRRRKTLLLPNPDAPLA